MAVQADGADLGFNADIVNEFGGDAPHAISEYYGGGDLVPAGANPNVPTSGEVQFSDFYGAVAATVLTIGSNTQNYNIKTAAVNAGGDQSTPVILTINSGVTVSGSNNSTPAMKTDTGWSNGVTINIINNGSIVGSAGSDTTGNPSSGGGTGGVGGGNNNGGGGAGGAAGSAGSAGSGSAESANNGGIAFEHSQTGDNNLSVIFDTAGTRTGGAAGTKTITGNGGGGGGGGANGRAFCAGGGGGGGANGGGGGGGGNAHSGGGSSGSGGGSTSGGAGGGFGGGLCNASGNNPNCSAYHGNGGNGGSGGNVGSSGSAGSGGGPAHNCHGGGPGGGGGSGGAAGSNGTANGSAGAALSGNTDQIS